MKKTLKILSYPFFNWYLFMAKKFLKRKKIISPPLGEIRISYADLAPKNVKWVHGGRIKLFYLSQSYPERKKCFNILYLTSSAMPRLVKDWMQICKKSNVKIVWNQDGAAYPAWAGDDYGKINGLMGQMMRQSDWVIYQSKFCKLSADKFLGSFEGPHSIIYNCVDTSSFNPGKNPMSLSPLRLLVMGTHDRSYRVIRAIESICALRRMKIDAELNIAGRLTWSGAKREVVNKVNLLGLSGKIFISGAYLQKDAPAVYRQSHILLHLKYKDPCPTVVLEAMACGIPVIGSMSGGLPELLGKDGGMALEVPETWEQLLAPRPEAIAEAVIQVMKSWADYSKRARKQALNNFNKEKWLKAHEAIFNKVTVT